MIWIAALERPRALARRPAPGRPSRATGPAPVDPKDFYYNVYASKIELNQDRKWGGLTIKNSFDGGEFDSYKFIGIISFNDA